MFFFGSLMLDWAQTQIAAGPIQFGKIQVEPARAMEWMKQQLRVLSGTRETFAVFFGYQGAMTMIVLTLSGAVLVGNDFASRGVSFFLAKPISPWHYLLGKFLAVGIVIHLLTTVPALLLFGQNASNDWNYLLDPEFFRNNNGQGPAGWPLLLGIFGYAMVLTFVLGILLVTTAAWMERTMPLILVWTSGFLFARALAIALVNLHQDARWRLLDLWNSLGLLGQACLGFDHKEINPTPQPSFTEAAIVLGGVCVLCLFFLHLRMRRLEVVRT